MKKIDKLIDKANIFFRKKRDFLFRPVLKILDTLGVSANFLSISKIFFAGLYLYFINTNFSLAIIFLVFGGIFIDFFDGPLARYTGIANDRGKFIDMFSDQLVYVFAILGIIILNISDPILLTYNIIIIGAFYLTIIIDKNENEETDWIIKPIARASYYKLFMEIAVIGFLFFSLNKIIFDRMVIIINIIITIHFIYRLINFSIRKNLK